MSLFNGDFMKLTGLKRAGFIKKESLRAKKRSQTKKKDTLFSQEQTQELVRHASFKEYENERVTRRVFVLSNVEEWCRIRDDC